MIFQPSALLKAWQLSAITICHANSLTKRRGLFINRRRNLFFNVPRIYTRFNSNLQHQNYLYRLGIPIRIIRRLIFLNILFLPILITSVPLYYFSNEGGRKLSFHLLNWCLHRAGATFIKLGQWASTRPDILPRDFCDVLSTLHTGAPKHKMSWNRYIFEAELGRSLESVFKEFSEEPVGSGTIAQVHRAILRDGGFEVAVKISHPRIREKIDLDLHLLSFLASIVDATPGFSWLNLSEEVSCFKGLMHQQLDLRREAYTLDHFSRNFSTWKSVQVPTPIYPLISPSILTETFAQGTSIGHFSSDAALLKQLNPSQEKVWIEAKKKLATIGLQSFLQMLLWDNFVHADLHPGNILVRFVNPKDGSVQWDSQPTVELVSRIEQENLIPQIVYIDTGLVTTLARRDFQNFNDLFIALVLHGDGYQVGKLIVERSRYPQDSVKDPESFYQSMDNLIRPLFGGKINPKNIAESMQLGKFTITPTLGKVFDLVRIHHVRLDPSFTNLVMSFVCVEGLGRDLSPELNLLPYLAKAALQYLVTNVAFTIA